MFKLTIWTDFGVPRSDLFVTEEAAHAKGRFAVAELGCARYTVTPDRPTEWRPASKITTRNYRKNTGG